MEPVRLPRGTVDLTGDLLARHRAVEQMAHETFGAAGYGEIRTPVFEETRLFSRAIGETTDVVEKEMFTIPREGEPYSLRPEGTASVVRWYLENKLDSAAPFQKVFYVGPMFRYERPQAGRQRQFSQVGIEALGSADPRLDAEVISLLDRFFRRLGIEGHEMRLNTLGGSEERAEVRAKLLEALEPRRADLCPDCGRRIDRNVFRVLDCKKETCREIAAGLPRLPDLVSAESREHYETVKGMLADLGVATSEDPFLVRGLDYYTHTVFEAVHSALGAQDSICGGGRYDGLVSQFGGPETPATGFAVGVERVLLVLEKLGVDPVKAAPGLDAYVVSVKPEGRPETFKLVNELRDAGLATDADFEGRGMKAQMKKAARGNAARALILGPGEIERGTVTVRDMETGEQVERPREGLVEFLQE
ncbi:MAG: histidine--tRNA ligase [Planctomycetota bacterium]